MTVSGGGGILTSKAFNSFITRTSGLDITHKNAYMDLLDGLTIDGLFNTDGSSSFFDVLYVFATQNSTTALLNLVSSSFAGTATGSPTFTTDLGYTGVEASTTVFIDTGFNPSTAPTPKFTLNSAHLSAWGNTNVTRTSSALIGLDDGVSVRSQIIFDSANCLFHLNNQNATDLVIEASTIGHWLADRTGSAGANHFGYKNAVDQSLPGLASSSVPSTTFHVLGNNSNGTAGGGCAAQVTMASIGAGMTSTQVTNFYNRLRTYMTAVGVP